MARAGSGTHQAHDGLKYRPGRAEHSTWAPEYPGVPLCGLGLSLYARIESATVVARTCAATVDPASFAAWGG